MTVNTEPEALVSPLQSDGSAVFSYAGYTIAGSVNGPLEIQRRDELPEEAVVDVIVRPAAGVGGTRERHLESLLQATLRQVILINNFPRTLIQITLQITAAPENDYVNAKVAQAGTNLPILPALIQTAVLSLLSAAIPMTATLMAATVAVLTEDEAKKIVFDPTAREIEKSRSLHIFEFTSHGHLILAESEGEFTMKEWDDVLKTAHQQCCTEHVSSGDVHMTEDVTQTGADLGKFTRSTMEQKLASDLCWK